MPPVIDSSDSENSFAALSEVAAPEPVQKQQHTAGPRLPSLEESISTLQKRRHSR